MTRSASNTLIALIVLLVPAFARAEKTKVACVGDSITAGYGVAGNDQYPVVLGKMLGDGYDVKNFGVSGTTMLKKGDNPYWKQGAFKQATEFGPDIVIIMLGTNDTKGQNWSHKDEFEADYKAMVEHFKSLPSKPKVYAALPATVVKSSFGINEKGVLEQQPMIKSAADATGAVLINVHDAVCKSEQFMGDGVHPNAAGDKQIAATVAKTVGTGAPAKVDDK